MGVSLAAYPPTAQFSTLRRLDFSSVGLFSLSFLVPFFSSVASFLPYTFATYLFLFFLFLLFSSLLPLYITGRESTISFPVFSFCSISDFKSQRGVWVSLSYIESTIGHTSYSLSTPVQYNTSTF